MRIYFDTSALAKLVIPEAESDALLAWVDRRQDGERVTSALARTELVRAVGADDHEAVAKARRVLDGLTQMALTDQILDDAAGLDPSVLRTLDAIHLASASRVGPDLEAVVTYDLRMVEAAQAMGLPVAHPGRP